MRELTYHASEIRSMMFNIKDAIGDETFVRELMSYLDTDTLRDFAENLLLCGEFQVDDAITYN